jgi:UbiD family decarboxylase
MRNTARRAATRGGGRDTRMIVVVDDHTDIANINEVLWAVASRWDPKRQSEMVDVTARDLRRSKIRRYRYGTGSWR